MDELLPMITEKDGIPVTTSKAVAEQFEKRHDSVIRDIENLLFPSIHLDSTDQRFPFLLQIEWYFECESASLSPSLLFLPYYSIKFYAF